MNGKELDWSFLFNTEDSQTIRKAIEFLEISPRSLIRKDTKYKLQERLYLLEEPIRVRYELNQEKISWFFSQFDRNVGDVKYGKFIYDAAYNYLIFRGGVEYKEGLAPIRVESFEEVVEPIRKKIQDLDKQIEEIDEVLSYFLIEQRKVVSDLRDLGEDLSHEGWEVAYTRELLAFKNLLDRHKFINKKFGLFRGLLHVVGFCRTIWEKEGIEVPHYVYPSPFKKALVDAEKE